MVLSNAERQRRYREKLKAIARGDELARPVRAVVEAALEVVWRIGNAPDRGDFDEFATLADYKASLHEAKVQRANGAAIVQLRSLFVDFDEDATEEERKVLARAVAVIDAASLRDE